MLLLWGVWMVKSLPSISGAVNSGLGLEGDSLTLFVGGSGVGEGVVTLTSGFSGAGGASGTGFDSFDIDAVGAGVTAAGVGGSLTGLLPGLLPSFGIEVVGFPATCAGVGGGTGGREVLVLFFASNFSGGVTIGLVPKCKNVKATMIHMHI